MSTLSDTALLANYTLLGEVEGVELWVRHNPTHTSEQAPQWVFRPPHPEIYDGFYLGRGAVGNRDYMDSLLKPMPAGQRSTVIEFIRAYCQMIQ